jgi:hypothetical protein
MISARRYAGPEAMARFSLGLLLLLAVPALLGRGDPVSETDRFLADYDAIRSFYPRPEGSAGEKRMLGFLERRLQELAVPYTRLDFRESDQNHSFSACLVAEVAGQSADTLLIGVPINHPPEAAAELDGSINVALGLRLLERLRGSRPPLSVKVLFLGAEYGEEPEYPMGSRLFLRDFFPDQRVMTLYLNLKRIPSRLHLRAGGRGVESPYWLLDRCTRALRATDIFFLMRGNENQIFRVGLTSERTIIEPFLRAGYPAISMEGEYAELTPAERDSWLRSFDHFLEAFLGAFPKGIPESWDRHYLFFQARGFYFSISEGLYLLILLGVLAGVLIYGLVFTRRLRKYLRVLLRHLWFLPLFFAFIFGLLFLSTWLLSALLLVRNLPELWQDMPLLFLCFKLAVPLALLFLLLNVVKRLPMPRRGSFYSAAALLFLLVDILVLAVINISFTYYFLWAFVFALLFSVARNRILKVLFFLASPYWVVKTVIELFTLPRLEFCRVLLLSPVWGNLLLATVLVPFVLMLVRLRFIFPPARIIRDRARMMATAAVFVAVLGGLSLVFFLYAPYGGGRKQPVLARFVLNGAGAQSYLQLESPAPLGRLELWDRQTMIPVNTRSRSALLPLPETPQLLQTESSSVAFLDRKNISLRLSSKGELYRIRIRLAAAQEFVLYDANFPFLRAPGGREYEILVGANPPSPLSIQLTVPRNMTFQLALTLEYLQPPEGYALHGDGKIFTSRLTLSRNLELRT